MPSDNHPDAKRPDAKPGDMKAAAKAPAPAKRAREDVEDAAPPASEMQQKTLPTGLSRAIVIASLVFAVVYGSVELLRDRYAISPVPNSPNSFVYRIDRLTGSLHFCGTQQCTVVHVRAAE